MRNWRGRYWTIRPRPNGSETCDHGVAQINQIWIKQWSLDRERLINDDEYNLIVSAKILSDLKKRFSKIESNWFGRYNTSNPVKRIEYEARITKHLKKTNSQI